ncbi:MAG: phosphate ABC transporter substrate-binding protein [Candidatus Thiodiazotropha sp. (ex Epidulcina cf. delphinae)]|nr:phosphate ABC transporter substrate-binding protein [Candidatus Thiodiazotropha sp. (ex Epidulcina cf. delphinae)]
MKRNFFIAVSLATTTLFYSLPANAADRTIIQNKGSDTLVNVAQAWAEAYRDVDADIAVAVSGGGSGTGIAAMINGTVDIANTSRKMKSKEVKMAKGKGQHPFEHVVGYDALAVFIHNDNPIKSLSFEQLKSIFGRGGKATKWSDIGINVPGCKSDKIVVVSRQNNSGTYAYFKKAALGKKGKFRQGTLDMHGSKDVVDLVEKTPCAIGYSGLAYATDHIKMTCIAKQNGGECVNPSVETASDHSYPIARPLFMYTNGEPKGAVKTYLDWIKSDAGQCILMKKGYAPSRDVSCG